jgi:AraC family transcriptional regulator
MTGMDSTTELRPVPFNRAELVRELQCGELGFSDSLHRTDLPLHSHENATITLLLQGSFEETYRGTRASQAFSAGTALLRPPVEPHSDRFGPEGARNLVVEIGALRLQKLMELDGVFGGIISRQDGNVQVIALRMAQELAFGDSAAPLALEGFTLELMAHLARFGEFDGKRTRSRMGWLDRARDLLHDEFRCRQIRIADLAAEVDIHPVYFARAFRRRFGLNPGEYLRQLRLAWAASALGLADRSIAQIAAEAGFADQSHFTREFRRAFGQTPGQFRAEPGRFERP